MIRTRLHLAFTAFLLISLLNWHCTKIDTTSLGSGLIPVVDNVKTFDTLINVIANNYDSIPFSGKECSVIFPTDEHALGYIGNDPYFGTTTASIYTELKPLRFPFAFEAKPADRTLDSIVLILSYKRVFGDATIPQRVQVHEISKLLFRDTSTCSFNPYNPTALGSASYRAERLTDTIKAFKDTATHQLRIRLSASFGQQLLARDTIKSDSAFKNILKGFAIVPDNAGNALTYYSLTDGRTRLAIYYKYKRPSLPDSTLVTNFNLFTGDYSGNHIVRNRGASEITLSSNNNSNQAGDNFIYIQTAPGSFAELKIPGVTGLSNRIIHRAELVIDQAFSLAPTDKLFTPPTFLFLELRDTALKGAYHPVPCDFNTIDGSPDLGTYGGFKTNAKDALGRDIARYTFNISRYVQKIITNKRSLPVLRLRAPTYVTTTGAYRDECGTPILPLFFSLNRVAEGRIKIQGGSTSPNRVRLRLIYSTL